MLRQAVARGCAGLWGQRNDQDVIARAMTLLDERLDAVASAARQVVPVRIGVGVGAALLSANVFGVVEAAVWLVAFGLVEACIRVATRPIGLGLAMSVPQRLAYLGSMFASSVVWCGLAVLAWSDGADSVLTRGPVTPVFVPDDRGRPIGTRQCHRRECPFPTEGRIGIGNCVP